MMKHSISGTRGDAIGAWDRNQSLLSQVSSHTSPKHTLGASIDWTVNNWNSSGSQAFGYVSIAQSHDPKQQTNTTALSADRDGQKQGWPREETSYVGAQPTQPPDPLAGHNAHGSH